MDGHAEANVLRRGRASSCFEPLLLGFHECPETTRNAIRVVECWHSYLVFRVRQIPELCLVSNLFSFASLVVANMVLFVRPNGKVIPGRSRACY